MSFNSGVCGATWCDVSNRATAARLPGLARGSHRAPSPQQVVQLRPL